MDNNDMKQQPQTRKPVMLVVLDGWGNAPAGPFNAISVAQTPVFDQLIATRPVTEIAAHGKSVGLPSDQMGNSEVGHLNLGAGRVVKQDLVKIDDAIEDGSFSQNPVFQNICQAAKAKTGRVHLIGLCSPGGVHSSLEHLHALVTLFSDAGLEVFIHAITDGRDTPPSSARGYLQEMETRLAGKARIAVVVGRFWSMDRDKRWDRVEKGYRAHVQGEGTPHASADEAVAAAYAAGQTDEFIEPRIIVDADGRPLGTMSDGDATVFFNFRADRAREITAAFTQSDFSEFAREKVVDFSAYATMTEYHQSYGLPIAFPKDTMDNILGKVLADRGMRQFRCAETEKYAHVTFFFNGGVETPCTGEDRQLIPSPKEVATYDLKPEMSAAAVGDAVVARLKSHDDDFILVNFANPDMVGHTGILAAAVQAIQAVDAQVGRLCDAVLAKGGALLITADHGNSEQMRDEVTDQPYTAHTLNPVPVILVDEQRKAVALRTGGSLRDVAPTVLELIGLDKPAEMTGASLIQ